MTANLADFADVAVSGNYSTPGFGSIEKRVSERQQEFIYGIDASSTVRLDKFFGDQSGINLPMYVGYSRNIIKPLYDPLSPDLIFEKGVNENESLWKNRFYNGIFSHSIVSSKKNQDISLHTKIYSRIKDFENNFYEF